MKASCVFFRKYQSFISSILVRVILLSSWLIQESLSFVKGPLSLCVFKLLGLSSILGSVMSIMFLYLLKDPYELLFKGCSLSCKRVDHFVINFVHSTTNFRELSFLEVNSPLPYLACKWQHHHSSLGLGWLRSPPMSGVLLPFFIFYAFHFYCFFHFAL